VDADLLDLEKRPEKLQEFYDDFEAMLQLVDNKKRQI